MGSLALRVTGIGMTLSFFKSPAASLLVVTGGNLTTSVWLSSSERGGSGLDTALSVVLNPKLEFALK